jgi:sugar/nucleoside kinase (ribokinase family)
MFEPTAADYPDLCRLLCRNADLVFLNQVEYRLLFGQDPRTNIPMIIKSGAAGAGYVAGNSRLDLAAPPADAVDTTGAGEILAGVFLSLRTLGINMADALRYAVLVASAKVNEFGVDGPQVDAALATVRDAVQELPKKCSGTHSLRFSAATLSDGGSASEW